MTWFKRITSDEIARVELEEAKCDLLKVESKVEFYSAMRCALKTKIARLSAVAPLVQIEEKDNG